MLQTQHLEGWVQRSRSLSPAQLRSELVHGQTRQLRELCYVYEYVCVPAPPSSLKTALLDVHDETTLLTELHYTWENVCMRATPCSLRTMLYVFNKKRLVPKFYWEIIFSKTLIFPEEITCSFKMWYLLVFNCFKGSSFLDYMYNFS